MQWWPTRSRWAVGGMVNFFDRLIASVPSSISTASPTDQDVDVGGAEAQPVVVSVCADTIDVVNMRGADRVTAARLPKYDGLDIFAPHQAVDAHTAANIAAR
jgi:hypothetical protein